MPFLTKHGWKILVSLSVFITAWVGFGFIKNFISYQKYSRPQSVKITGWEILFYGEEDFLVKAKYLTAKDFLGEYTFQRHYPSKEAAEGFIETQENLTQILWSANGQQGLLERSFPVKEAVRFCIGLGVCLYFFWLRHYVSVFSDA